MSDLPDRDEVLPSVFDDELRAIGFAYIRGELKSRDEMNLGAALAAVPYVSVRDMRDALDAAWEVADDKA